jgi:glutamine synthetase type III
MRREAESMDDLNRELELFEVIAASDAMNTARTELKERAKDAAGEDAEERWEAIRRYVFPLLEAEHERLAAEYARLRDGT